MGNMRTIIAISQHAATHMMDKNPLEVPTLQLKRYVPPPSQSSPSPSPQLPSQSSQQQQQQQQQQQTTELPSMSLEYDDLPAPGDWDLPSP